MNKAYKFKLVPNAEQRMLLAKTFGCCRFIYNRMLADKIAHYAETGQSLYCYPSQYKTEFPWLREVDALALVGAYNALQSAYKNFFRDKKIGFPKFKSKHAGDNSYTTNLVNNNIALANGFLKLPKLGLGTDQAAPADTCWIQAEIGNSIADADREILRVDPV